MRKGDSSISNVKFARLSPGAWPPAGRLSATESIPAQIAPPSIRVSTMLTSACAVLLICGDESFRAFGESDSCWEEADMLLAITTICVAILLAMVLAKRAKDRRELERHSITPEALHALLASNQEVVVVDVRHPLDLFGDSNIIPGAHWLAPEQVRANPSLLPKDRDLIVYCTCPSDKTSRTILRRALAMGFSRIAFLTGGLDGWRANGFPVEPYKKPLHVDAGKPDLRATAR